VGDPPQNWAHRHPPTELHLMRLAQSEFAREGFLQVAKPAGPVPSRLGAHKRKLLQ